MLALAREDQKKENTSLSTENAQRKSAQEGAHSALQRHTEDVARLEARRKEWDAEKANIAREMHEAKTKISSLEDEQLLLQSRHQAAHERDHAKWKGTLQRVEHELEKKEGLVVQLKDNIAKLESKVEKLDRDQESKVAELKKSQDKIASLEQLLTEQAQKHQTVRTELEERLLSGLKDRQQLAADKDLLMQVQMDAMEEIHSKKVLEV